MTPTFAPADREGVVTRFESGRPIRSRQPKRDGERNEAINTFIYGRAALQGLICMGLKLNDEVERVARCSFSLEWKPPSVMRLEWVWKSSGR